MRPEDHRPLWWPRDWPENVNCARRFPSPAEQIKGLPYRFALELEVDNLVAPFFAYETTLFHYEGWTGFSSVWGTDIGLIGPQTEGKIIMETEQDDDGVWRLAYYFRLLGWGHRIFAPIPRPRYQSSAPGGVGPGQDHDDWLMGVRYRLGTDPVVLWRVHPVAATFDYDEWVASRD